MWANSEGSVETADAQARLACAFAVPIRDKYPFLMSHFRYTVSYIFSKNFVNSLSCQSKKKCITIVDLVPKQQLSDKGKIFGIAFLSRIYRLYNHWASMYFENEPRHDKTNKMSVRPAKTQINLGIRPVWSESSMCAQWVANDPSFLHADSEDSDQTLIRLICVFAGRTLILLVLSCCVSNYDYAL